MCEIFDEAALPAFSPGRGSGAAAHREILAAQSHVATVDLCETHDVKSGRDRNRPTIDVNGGSSQFADLTK